MISEVRKQVWCPSAGSKTQDAKIPWCLLERTGGSYDDSYTGALAEIRLESQASPQLCAWQRARLHPKKCGAHAVS